MPSSPRRWLIMIALATVASHAWSVEGPLTPSEQQAWEGLRARLALGTAAPVRNDTGLGDTEPQRVNSLTLMGDYYLSRPWLGTSGGWRATSGVLFGSRSTLWSSPSLLDRRMAPVVPGGDGGDTTATLPYLGVGYTGWSSKGGWGLSADVGLMAVNPRSATRLGGRPPVTGQSMDDSIRDLRFAPLVQLGLSYSF